MFRMTRKNGRSSPASIPATPAGDKAFRVAPLATVDQHLRLHSRGADGGTPVHSRAAGHEGQAIDDVKLIETDNHVSRRCSSSGEMVPSWKALGARVRRRGPAGAQQAQAILGATGPAPGSLSSMSIARRVALQVGIRLYAAGYARRLFPGLQIRAGFCHSFSLNARTPRCKNVGMIGDFREHGPRLGDAAVVLVRHCQKIERVRVLIAGLDGLLEETNRFGPIGLGDRCDRDYVLHFGHS